MVTVWHFSCDIPCFFMFVFSKTRVSRIIESIQFLLLISELYRCLNNNYQTLNSYGAVLVN